VKVVFKRAKNYRRWIAAIVVVMPLCIFAAFYFAEWLFRVIAELFRVLNPGNMTFKVVNNFARWVKAGDK